MARPTSGTTIQRPELGAIAYEYMLGASQMGFIGVEVLPFFEVEEKTADYPKIPMEALLVEPNTQRQSRGGYARSDWEFETGTYACEEHGWEEVIDDSESALYARFFDMEEVSTLRAMDIILRAHERRAAALLFNTSNAVGNAAAGTEWSTAASCTPRADVMTAKQAMRAASGLSPNALVMSKKVFENLLVSAEIADRFQYTTPIETLSMEAQKSALASYFDVSRVVVGGEVRNTAKKGQAFSLSDIWDDEYCSLAVLSNGSRDLREPAFGRTFLWTADSPDPVVVETYRSEEIRSDVVRARHNVDEAIQFTGANYLLTNITA